MRKAIKFQFLLLIFFAVMGLNSYAMDTTYCTKPPFIQTKIPSNIMLVLDYSGSMGWYAYDHDDGYDKTKTYYGYFKPDKFYKYDSTNNYYYITNSPTNTGDVCSNYYSDWSGNCLNYSYMTRVDILRWILTGGKVLGNCVSIGECSDFTTYSDCAAHNWHGGLCYWRSWPWWRRGCRRYWGNSCETLSSCSDSDLCQSGDSVVATENDERIKIEDVSSYDSSKGEVVGILQQIRDQEQKPRIGAVLFSGSVIDRVKLSDEYVKLINTINDEDPDGSTCTKCAVDEMDNLFQEKSWEVGQYGDPYKWGADNETVRCAKNFILVMSDGEWNTGGDPVSYIDNMWKGGRQDLVSTLSGNQNARTYSVAMFLDSNNGKNALKWMAVYGNYDDLNNNGYPCNRSSYPDTSLTTSENLENSCGEVKPNKDNSGPYGYFKGDNPKELKSAIIGVFSDILKQISSGTATSILSEKERVNAGILQAAFYPQKVFTQGSSSKTISWAGSLYNWWFYTSETGQTFKSNIREDTIENKDLDICSNGVAGGDYIINYEFEENKLKIKAYKSLCTGDNASSTADAVYDGLDEAHPVWEAGRILAEENPMDRKIYTYVGGTQPTSVENLVELKSLTNSSSKHYSKLFGDEDVDGVIDDSAETIKYAKAITFSNLKSYIYGVDISSDYRERKIDTSGDVWKLGDIVYSTPKIVNYDDYTVAFVGANDGMLHAFKVGKYRYDRLGVYQLSKLRNDRTYENTNELGKELWAFIPKNSLPYLRFLADPDYSHMYYVDLTPSIIEVDNNSDGVIDKRILICGMRLGGAVGCDNSSVCINPPQDTCDNMSAYTPNKDPMVSTSNYCLGLSSYFALDITDPTQPKFLWEFTNKDLGFSYSGPTFIKRKISNSFNDYDYYVMFASGPTNYNGDVGQKLKLFVLSLNSDFTISSTHTINVSDKLGLGDAFAGRMSKDGIVDKGSTKAVFFGAVYKDGDDWRGNVVGVKPNDDNPANWTMFKLFSNPIGPVVVPISYYECNVNGSKKGFLYFGSGRYFFRDDDPGSDSDSSDFERLYGVKIDRCLTSSGSSSCSINNGSEMYQSSNVCAHIGDSIYGWYQNLNPAEEGYNKERDITGTTNSTMDAVFFTTTEPTSDICGFGGRSRMWGMNCATGESLIHQTCSTTGRVVGTLLLQTSVGKITRFDMNINPQEPKKSKNPFVKENDKATKWTVGTAPPDTSSGERSKKSPAEILYEIEK